MSRARPPALARPREALSLLERGLGSRSSERERLRPLGPWREQRPAVHRAPRGPGSGLSEQGHRRRQRGAEGQMNLASRLSSGVPPPGRRERAEEGRGAALGLGSGWRAPRPGAMTGIIPESLPCSGAPRAACGSTPGGVLLKNGLSSWFSSFWLCFWPLVPRWIPAPGGVQRGWAGSLLIFPVAGGAPRPPPAFPGSRRAEPAEPADKFKSPPGL